MLHHASLALRLIAGKEDDYGVKIGARQPANPIVWMILACVA
jgi:hypothetical protein